MNTRPRALEVILLGGLTVGVLDALDATIFFGIRNGVRPSRVFQSIAGGIYGRATYNLGTKTVVLGVLLHFLVATLIATGYWIVSLLLPAVTRWAVVSGITYGIAAYFVMNYVVLPLSAVGWPRFALGPFINGVIGHAFLVGLPVALIARWSANRRSK